MKYNKATYIDKSNRFNSILAIGSDGLFRLYCPFNARCIKRVAFYSIGDNVVVIAFEIDDNDRLLYIINGKRYYHYYFMIIK